MIPDSCWADTTDNGLPCNAPAGPLLGLCPRHEREIVGERSGNLPGIRLGEKPDNRCKR